MFRNVLASAVILYGSVAPSFAATDAASGTVYFRYKTAQTQAVTTPENESKDITAFYVGGVKETFSEKLPMKAQWQNDNWVVTGGSLPDGISFNSETLTFTGTPGKAQSAVVELTGFGANGEAVATASASFDIVVMPDYSKKVDLYGHTGTYFFKQFDIPAGMTVDRWRMVYALPEGLTTIGRNIDGTPTKAGNYRYLMLGYPYQDGAEAIVAYSGTFIVEDKSEFPQIADKLYAFDPAVEPYALLFSKVPVTPINRVLGKASDVRYYVDVQSNENLPGNLKVSQDAFNRYIDGEITTHYDQATIRYRAKDIDDRESVSNWFKIGSLGPTPKCGVYRGDLPPSTIGGWAGTPISPYGIPTVNSTGTRSYVMTGTLPEGISFNNSTGVFSGTPVKEEKQSGIMVEVNVANSGNVDSVTCGPYAFDIAPASFGLKNSVATRDIRVGETVDGKLIPGGGLLGNWSIAIDDPAALPPTVNYAGGQSLTVKGPVNVKGDFAPAFTLTNGNGRTAHTTMSFSVHDALTIENVPETLSIKKYDSTESLFQAIYDPTAIIGSAKFEITGGNLPSAATPLQSLSLNAFTGLISGGTVFDPGSYGPFKIRLTDDHGGSIETNPFSVEVLPRDNMVGTTTAPTFTVNYEEIWGRQPLTVVQPKLAEKLAKTWTVNKPLPDGLTFDHDSGRITGMPTQVGTFPGYQISVTDTDGGNAQSETFAITIQEPQAPQGNRQAAIEGNVNGRAIVTKTPTFVADTLIGGVSAVKYVDATPAIPGLTFIPATGVLSGQPTAEYHGDVNINFVDGASRPGNAPVQIDIYPYPAVSMEKAIYELPRLSQAASYDITAKPNTGFYGGVTYKLAPISAALPTGLTLDTTNGKVTGQVSAAVGEYKNIVIRATDKVSGLTADTQAFSIKVVTPVPLTLTSDVPLVTYKLKDQTWDYVSNSGITFAPVGSYAAPLTYSLQNAPAGLDVNPQTGRLIGSPAQLGAWTATLNAVDAEGTAATPYDFNIKATLSGYIASTSSAQAPGDVASGAPTTVRIGQTFQTAAQAATNYVGSLTYTGVDNPATMPVIDSSKGIFRGSIDVAGTYLWSLSVKDSDGRGYYDDTAPVFSATVIDPLQLSISETSFNATQFSASKPVSIQFPKTVTNKIGKILYGVVGTLPGDLYYLNYANNDLSGTKSWSHQEADGSWTTSSSGSLPNDALVFDTLLATLNGVPSAAGTFSNLYLVASDDHDTAYIADDPTKEDYNSASAGPFTISVDTQPLKIASSANPKQVIVPDGNANVTLSPVNHAYGKAVTWAAGTGNLPSGITYKINGNNVDFTGYWTTKGTYSIPFTVTDALGRTATATQEFKVVLSTDPIELNVANITSKVGFPVKMEPPYASAALTTGNSFGTLVFASTDLAAHPGVSLNPSTGDVSGSLGATQTFTFNMSVTDETNRITSKPVTVDIIPNLRLVYQTQSTVTQGAETPVTVDTAYNIGAVSYELAAGQTLPAGLTLDTTTGTIKGIPAASAGTYTGFVVYGTDALGDRQPSNTFSIIVKPINAKPMISSITNNKLAFGTVGAAFTFTPTVKDSVKSQAWVYPATYTINHDLTGTGLTFDATTGVISGTPTTPVYFSDLVIGVSNDTGGSSTAPFIFGIQPSTPMTAAAGQTAEYKYRVGDAISIPAPVFDNTWGSLTYTASALPAATTMAAATGIVSGTPTTAAATNAVVTVTDVFGRTAQFTYKVTVNAALNLTFVPPTTTVITQGSAYAAMNLTSSNAVGTKTYEVIGLPTGFTYSATAGAIQGTVPVSTYANGTQFPIEVWLTDGFDQKKVKATYTLTVVDTFQAKAGQTFATTIRDLEAYSFPAPVFENAVGAVTYTGYYYTTQGGSIINGSINASTGVVTLNPVLSYRPSASYVIITAKDSLGRTATLRFDFSIVAPLSLTLTGRSYSDGDVVARNKPVTVTSALGPLTYGYSGLPAGLQFDSTTGEIYGTVNTGIQTAQTYTVTASVTDTFNNKTVTGSLSIYVQAAGTYSLFTPLQGPAASYTDSSQLGIGVKFKSNVDGKVTGIKFYRSVSDTGQNVVDLWTSTGTKLATASFTNTTATGWQTVYFATPVSITANTVYVASYHSTGYYVSTQGGLGSPIVSGPLTATGGAYGYGGNATTGVFPGSASAANYWADVIFVK